MFRYSMLTLLLVVSVLALFSAAFANPTMVFARLIVSLTLLVLLSCTFHAALSRPRRPFILGFTMAGWLYYLLALSFLICTDNSFLVTGWALDEFAGALHEELEDVPTYSQVVASGEPPSGDSPDEKKYRFSQIGHCLYTLVFAAIGGLAAIWLRRPRPPTTN